MAEGGRSCILGTWKSPNCHLPIPMPSWVELVMQSGVEQVKFSRYTNTTTWTTLVSRTQNAWNQLNRESNYVIKKSQFISPLPTSGFMKLYFPTYPWNILLGMLGHVGVLLDISLMFLCSPLIPTSAEDLQVFLNFLRVPTSTSNVIPREACALAPVGGNNYTANKADYYRIPATFYENRGKFNDGSLARIQSQRQHSMSLTLGIQSHSQMMIGMSNHLLSIVFRFHCHSQKVIGSLDNYFNSLSDFSPYFTDLKDSWNNRPGNIWKCLHMSTE